MINVNKKFDLSWTSSESWLLLNCNKGDVKWLGDGKTSDHIIDILKRKI
jgi:hypothetical protein